MACSELFRSRNRIVFSVFVTSFAVAVVVVAVFGLQVKSLLVALVIGFGFCYFFWCFLVVSGFAIFWYFLLASVFLLLTF